MISWNETVWTHPCKWTFFLETYKADMIKCFQWWAFSANSSIKEDEPKFIVIAMLETKCCLQCFIIHNVMQCWCKDCTAFPSNVPWQHVTAFSFHVQLSGGERSQSVTAISHAHLSILGCTTSHLSSAPASSSIKLTNTHTRARTHTHTPQLYLMQSQRCNPIHTQRKATMRVSVL